MLSSLYIKNFALIDELNVDFANGLNIITGETGAGKSIIIDAFMAVLGERVSSSVIRRGEKKAVIEATFDIAKDKSVNQFISDNDLEDNGKIMILRREINSSGNSRSFVNDTPVNVSLLKNLGDILVDFHGQHEHQLLLNSKYHLQVLDSICDFGNLKNEWASEYVNLKKLISLIEKDHNSATESAFNAEKYSFELNEIEKINPQPQELDELEEKLKKAENLEEILSLCNGISGNLEDTDTAVCVRLTEVKEMFNKLLSFEPTFSDYSDDLTSATISLGEIAHSINSYKNNLSIDATELEQLRQRVFELNGLRKKYGSYEAVFERINFLKTELDNIRNFDVEIEKLHNHISASQKRLWQTGKHISDIRRTASVDFTGKLLNLLAHLGMPSATFEVQFSKELQNKKVQLVAVSTDDKCYSAFPDGIDKVQFMISANKGESLKPLKDTASGGEISRIMLALKAIIAEREEMPMLVFDEIDTGISGKTAGQTGLMMKKIASAHQVLAITHLPQIAALGDINLFVSKIEDEQRTKTSIKALDKKEKTYIIAQMISGSEISEASLKYAEDLIAGGKANRQNFNM